MRRFCPPARRFLPRKFALAATAVVMVVFANVTPLRASEGMVTVYEKQNGQGKSQVFTDPPDNPACTTPESPFGSAVNHTDRHMYLYGEFTCSGSAPVFVSIPPGGRWDAVNANPEARAGSFEMHTEPS